MFPKVKRKLGDLNIPVVLGVSGVHVLALLAVFPYFFSWSGLAICVVLYYVAATGITMGFHRLLTHKSFATPKWFKYFLTVSGTAAFQGSVMTWVGTHREHHVHSDEDGDPHSPRDGFMWAHVFWFIYKRLTGRPARDRAKDLQEDRIMVLIDQFFWLPQTALACLLFLLGYVVGGIHIALSWLIWGIGVRTIAGYHMTWAVNSVCHKWGYRNYKTSDNSRNNWWLSILTLGESFHNNHHSQPNCAAHGNRRWYEIDITYLVILLLERLGLVTNVEKPKTLRR